MTQKSRFKVFIGYDSREDIEGWHTRSQVPDPICVHFTEGGPWFDGYRNVEYAYEWNQTAGRVRSSQR